MIPGNKSRKLRYDHEYQLECLTYILQCKMYLSNRERSSLWCKYKPKTLRKVTSCKFKTRYDLQNLVETTKFKAMFRNTVEITIQRVSRGGGGCSRIPSEIFRLFHLFHLFPTDSSCSLVPPGHINTIFLALFPCVPIASNMLCSPAPYIWLWFFGLVPLFESSLQNRPCSQGDPRPKFSVVSKESLSIVSATHILSFIQDVILRSMFISNL